MVAGRSKLVKFKRPSAEDILNELDITSYLPSQQESNRIIAATQLALKSMEDDPTNYRLHVENVHKFMRELWSKFDCEDIYHTLDSLTRIEPALLDLERDPEAGKRYRDHYVHLFHVFVFGLRILSGLIRQMSDSQASEILKVRDEHLEGKIHGRNAAGKEVEFHDYSWKERTFYLWTLMATLHDIAIPITHLDNIRCALNEFSQKFHLEISGPSLVHRFSPDLDTYLSLISQLFEGKFEPEPSADWLYKKVNQGSYIKGYLERLVGSNHGVLGGYLAYKMIEEIFLQGKSQKYKLDAESFQHYKRLVLEEDIARATLAICLHDLKRDEVYAFPKFMPLNFGDYPLTFILIVADSLQEYLRWEGMSIRGDTKLFGFPSLQVTFETGKVDVECSFSVDTDPHQQRYFCEEIKRMTTNRGLAFTGYTIGNAANEFCKLIAEDIEKKLYLGSDFILRSSFFVGEAHMFTKTFGI